LIWNMSRSGPIAQSARRETDGLRNRYRSYVVERAVDSLGNRPNAQPTQVETAGMRN